MCVTVVDFYWNYTRYSATDWIKQVGGANLFRAKEVVLNYVSNTL